MKSEVESGPGHRFAFLDGPFAPPGASPRPVNVFELSGFPRWEAVASNVLAFFFDPNERHGLGTIFVDALLILIDGARVVGPTGVAATTVSASAYLGSSEWDVMTEQVTADGKRIDIYLTNDTLGIAVIIENKLDAAVCNPFESYARHAFDDYPTTLSVVLSPARRTAAATGAAMPLWTSAALTYDALFDGVEPGLKGPGEGADSRSMDLLSQFIENTSERRTQMDAAAENATLDAFWGALRGKEDSFLEFFRALDRVNQILKGRAERLRLEVAQRLTLLGITPDDSFVVAGYDHSWGRSEGLAAVVYLGFHFPDSPGVELMLGFIPARRQYEFTVKAYADRRKPNKCLSGYDHIPFAAVYVDTDAHVAEKFVALVKELLDVTRADRQLRAES